MIKRMMAPVLGVAALACALGGPAMADVPPTTVSSIQDVAWNIRAQFAVRYDQGGTVGNDWCFNADTERGYSWWYYKLASGGLTARKIRNTVRVQAIYNTSDVTRAYASMFMGIVSDETGSIVTQRDFDLNYTVLKDTTTATVAKRPTTKTKLTKETPPAGYQDVPVLEVPDASSDVSNCPTFQMFLNSYMLPNTDLAVKVPAVSRDEESFQPNYAGARWWMFNGRGHQVFNVTTYSLQVKPPGVMTPVPFTLVVGFGGGAGP